MTDKKSTSGPISGDDSNVKGEENTMKDFATGKPINISKPEEAVRQEYEKVLVNEFGYPKAAIDIEVPIQMGSSSKRCDIAVFDSEKKSKIIGIVETKRPGDTNGAEQLKSYMSATLSCEWGILTNGEETHYAKKLEDNTIDYPPNYVIPDYGTMGESALTYASLKPPSNLKRIFKHINQRLYANTNIPRKEKQGAEMVRLLFCKMVDEQNGRDERSKFPCFQIREGEKSSDVRERVKQLWDQVKDEYSGAGVFESGERISIDDYSLLLIVKELQKYSLLEVDQDVVGDAFEIFAERQFAGDKGQFFTPRKVVDMVVKMIDPARSDKILDPCCGSGGFLISAFNHITRKVPEDSPTRRRIAEKCLFGIDKDSDLVKICKAHMAIIGDGKSNVANADSLKDETEMLIDENGDLKKFDVIVTNPPFGSKIKVEHIDILKNYELAYKWKMKDDGWVCKGGPEKTPPQILFIERCLDLLKPGGKLGIVLPDGVLGNPGDTVVRHHIYDKASILAVVDCPVATFMPHTGTKTSVLILQKRPAEDEDVNVKSFFAISEKCGHTMRGKRTGENDFEAIQKNYMYIQGGGRQPYPVNEPHLGFYVQPEEDQRRRMILVPRYYDPRIEQEINDFDTGDYHMASMASLVEEAQVEVVGIQGCPSSEDYDIHGEVRFIRTSDISGYELAETTQKNITFDTYKDNKEIQDLRKNDILFVKDGDTKIGECAILLTDNDLRISVQSHFKKIRAIAVDPFLLLWALNTTIVKKQIRQRVFSQSTLSTIGERIYELKLPIPKQNKKQESIASKMRASVENRRKLLADISGILQL